MNLAPDHPDTAAAVTRHPERWLVGIALVAIALRLFRLGWRDYWHDEVHNLIKATQIDRVLFEGDMVSNHPPLFSILLALWQIVFPAESEWAMRLLPALIGVAGVIAIFYLGRETLGARAGLFAAFLLAVSPLHVFHSQDLKTYILLPFTGTITAYFLYRAVSTNRARHWALYTVSAALACYSDLFAGPLLAALGIWFLVQPRKQEGRVRNWILANAAGALLFLPQLGIMLSKFDAVINQTEYWWVPKPTLNALGFYLKAVAFGYSDLEPFFKIAMVAFAAFALAGIFLGAKVSPRAIGLLVAWSALSIAIVFVTSIAIGQSIFLIRAMLSYAIPVYVLTGYGIARVPRAAGRVVAAAAFAALAAMPLVEHYVGRYPEREFPHRPGIHAPVAHKALTQHVLANWQPGDAVVTTGNVSWLPCYWYGLRDRPHYLGTVGEDFIEMFRTTNPRNTDRTDFDGYFPRDVREVAPQYDRVWLVFTEWERVYLDGNPMQVWRWMDSEYTEIGHETFANIELFLYAKTDGVPIRVVKRDENDGVSARMTYASGRTWIYTKVLPDTNATPRAPEERQGDLTLRFVGPDADPGIEGAASSHRRTIAFAVENRSNETVACRIEAVPEYVGDDITNYKNSEPGDVALLPLQTTTWTVEVDADTPRIDIRLFERGAADGLHIYEVFQDGAS